jgi:hypothetical protein
MNFIFKFSVWLIFELALILLIIGALGWSGAYV